MYWQNFEALRGFGVLGTFDHISRLNYKYKCRNCIEANEGNSDLNLDFDHYIYDASCPVLQRQVQIERRSVKVIQ